MSARSNPFAELEQMFERMSRQFEQASRNWGSESPFASFSGGGEELAIDLVEHDDEFVVTVDLPGFQRDEVDVKVTDSTLHIDAEHDERIDEEEERYIHHERRHESAKRAIRLPEEVDPEGVSARMNNGVLTVTLPRIAAEEARDIEIE